ncbi:MAG: PadR family transcriptional regulator [Candidatus Woesearchaeota archaeon]
MKKIKKTIKKISSKLVPKHVELRGFLSFFILHELDSKNLSGDELAYIVGERRNTVLTPGTIYPALKRLRRQKLIQCRRRNGRKKIYFLTDSGKREIKALYLMFSDMFYGLKKKIK